MRLLHHLEHLRKLVFVPSWSSITPKRAVAIRGTPGNRCKELDVSIVSTHTISVTFMGTILSYFIAIMSSGIKIFSTLKTGFNNASTLPKRMIFTRDMLGNVCSSGKNNKVFDTIIRLIPVDMMYDFIGSKWSTQVFAHYKTVLCNISFCARFICIRMIGLTNKNVTTLINMYATAPAMIGNTLRSMTFYIGNRLPFTNSAQCPFVWCKFLPTTTTANHVFAPFYYRNFCIIPQMIQQLQG